MDGQSSGFTWEFLVMPCDGFVSSCCTSFTTNISETYLNNSCIEFVKKKSWRQKGFKLLIALFICDGEDMSKVWPQGPWWHVAGPNVYNFFFSVVYNLLSINIFWIKPKLTF